jgi:hypothetical protein
MLNETCDLVRASTPTAEIQHYSTLEGGCLSEATSFDLVILTGGVYDLTSPTMEPWVSQILDWVRDTYKHHSEYQNPGNMLGSPDRLARYRWHNRSS